MAAPPNRDKTILDIHADDQEAVAGNERERGIDLLLEAIKLERASKEKIGTSSTRNRLLVNPASGDTTRLPKPQEHCFKHKSKVMATPPNRDSTILDIHADDQGAVAGKEGEEGINVLLEVMKLECASKERTGTSSTRNRLPVNPASGDTTWLPKPQEHCFKHETDPQSSLVKANIPVITQVTDDQEKFFETCEVYKESQLLSLPHNLLSLKIEGCESLVVLPDGLLDGLPIHKELQLINCSSLSSISYPASLITLYIRKCRNFELLHWLESSKKLSSIQNMFIGGSCDSLITLTLDLFPKLKVLSIADCPNLVSFNVTGVYMGDLALECLEIKDCPGLQSFPDEGFHTPNLRSITLPNCTNLHKFPRFITSLTSLHILFLLRCPHIESFSNGGCLQA